MKRWRWRDYLTSLEFAGDVVCAFVVVAWLVGLLVKACS